VIRILVFFNCGYPLIAAKSNAIGKATCVPQLVDKIFTSAVDDGVRSKASVDRVISPPR
jgi:hypothetical protein